MIALLPTLLWIPLAAPAPSGGVDAEVEFTHEELSRWPWTLPTEVWRPLGEALELGGHRFAVEGPADGPALDTDADGRPDHRVRGYTDRAVLRGPEGYRYAVRLRRIGERWEWAPGGALTGRLGGLRIRLIDLDGDGRHDHHAVDGVVWGREPDVLLLSRVISLDGVLTHFELREEEGDTRARLSPYEGPVATLDVLSGFESEGDLECALFRRDDVVLDAAASGRPVLVPAGEYRLVHGRVALGARSARVGSGRLPPVALEPGETRVLEWGGPLSAEFTFQVQGSALLVHPDVRFFGRAGAEFLEFAPLVRAPRLEVRDVESDELVQYGRFGGCCGGGYSAWKATVPTGVELRVDLTHERKLFGEIRGRGRRCDRPLASDR